MLLKICPCALHYGTSPLSFQTSQSRLCPSYTYLRLQRQLSYLNGRKLGRRQLQASYPMLQHIHSHASEWLVWFAEFCVLSYIDGRFKAVCPNRRPLCTLENLKWCGEPCFAGVAILSFVCRKFTRTASVSYCCSNKSYMKGQRVSLMLVPKRSFLIGSTYE